MPNSSILKNSCCRFSIFFITLVIAGFTLHVSPVGATNMDSSNFRIQGGNVNMGANEESSEGYNLSTTVGQLAAQEFQSKGFIVKAGFQYINSIIPFQFSVSNTDIKIGSLIPQVPQVADTTLTVSFGSAGSYQVTTAEEQDLETQAGIIIPNTKCDDIKNACTELLAKPWVSKNTYGFGYNMSGTDIPTDFIDSKYFRPFPNKSKGEEVVVVMSNSNVGRRHQAVMTFKVNVPPEQEAASYQTVVNFIATPSF